MIKISTYFILRPFDYKLLGACKIGDLLAVQNILDELKTNAGDLSSVINLQGENGNSPLHLSAMQGKSEMTKILLEHNAPLDLMNNAGKTPSQIAKEKVFYCSGGHELEFIDNESTLAKYSKSGSDSDPASEWFCYSCYEDISGPHYHCSICPNEYDDTEYSNECQDCVKLKEESKIEIAKLIDHHASASSVAHEMNFDQDMPLKVQKIV